MTGIVCNLDTSDDHFGIKDIFANYLKHRDESGFDKCFLFTN